MRLIDADALYSEIGVFVPTDTQDLASKILSAIKDAPTAYDVEAVVAELEEASYLEWGGTVVLLRDGIEIVRGKE